jgi:hypothetical protein
VLSSHNGLIAAVTRIGASAETSSACLADDIALASASELPDVGITLVAPAISPSTSKINELHPASQTR